MSSGTTAEPIQPEAPVTKMRVEILLGRALGDEDARRRRRDRNADAIRSHQFETPPCDAIASLAWVMRSGLLS